MVLESAVIDHDIDHVWSVIRPLSFEFSSRVELCEIDSGKGRNGQVGIKKKKIFSDGSVQYIQLTELSDRSHTIAWNVCESEVSHVITLRPITTTNVTFIEWQTYNSDNEQEQKDLHREAFADLNEHLHDDDMVTPLEVVFRTMECGDSDSDSDDDSTTTDSKKGSRSKDRRLSETVGIVTSDVDWEAEIAKYRGE